MKPLNNIVESIKPSGIRKFFDLVGNDTDIISLSVGEPDFVTPWPIRDYAIKSIQRGETQYSSNRGDKKLLELISLYYETRFGISSEPMSEVMVTVGASEAIDLTLRALINPLDEVLVPDPSYVSYCPNISLTGGVPVPVETNAAKSFKLTVNALEKAVTPRTKALILPYPNNPTGAVMTADDLKAIIPFILKHDLYVICDEIYAELTYGMSHVSIASFDKMKERSIIISGFSKAFAMTGWRLGYIIAPEHILKNCLKIHQYTIMCAPTFSQRAAYSALRDGLNDNFAEVQSMRDTYNKRRLFMLDAFHGMGIDCFEPLGAFYLFPDVSKFSQSGDEFAQKLLEQKKVAAVPGSAFGQSGNKHIRCTYASSLKALMTAAERIGEFIKNKPLN